MKEIFDEIIERLCLERPELKLIRPDIAQVKEYNAYTRAIEIVKEVVKEYGNVCDCYHIQNNLAECWGTKERELCYCGGDKEKCDFYPKSYMKKENSNES